MFPDYYSHSSSQLCCFLEKKQSIQSRVIEEIDKEGVIIIIISLLQSTARHRHLQSFDIYSLASLGVLSIFIRLYIKKKRIKIR
jgi:hypothetical protein